MPAPCLGTVPWLEDSDASTVAKHVTLAPLGIVISADS